MNFFLEFLFSWHFNLKNFKKIILIYN